LDTGTPAAGLTPRPDTKAARCSDDVDTHHTRGEPTSQTHSTRHQNAAIPWRHSTTPACASRRPWPRRALPPSGPGGGGTHQRINAAICSVPPAGQPSRSSLVPCHTCVQGQLSVMRTTMLCVSLRHSVVCRFCAALGLPGKRRPCVSVTLASMASRTGLSRWARCSAACKQTRGQCCRGQAGGRCARAGDVRPPGPEPLFRHVAT
jgi:hypothetical protein